MNKKLKGMILAAGLGERLRPDTEKLPKPLFSIGNTNMIRNCIGFLLENGITDIAINTCHLKAMIIKELSWGVRDKVNLHIIEEDKIMGTAGGIKGAEEFIGDSQFLVINSDILIDLKVKELIKHHEKNGRFATLVVRDNPDIGRISTLAVNDDGKLIRFVDSVSPDYSEKSVVKPLRMFTGVTMFSPEIFEHIPANRECDISTEVYPKLMKEGKPIYTFSHTGYWADIGTHETYSKARMDVALNKFKTYII